MIAALARRGLEAFTNLALKHFPIDAGTSQTKLRFGAYTISSPDGSPYLTRVLLPEVAGIRPMLHHIHRPDADRDLHNHPWVWSLSLILLGGYIEERQDVRGGRIYHRRERWNFLSGFDFHSIRALCDDASVWTLFIHGPRVQGWGFLTTNGFVPWKEYIAMRK